MKQSKVFLEAAKRIASGENSTGCGAISFVQDRSVWDANDTAAHKLFAKYYKPANKTYDQTWFATPAQMESPTVRERVKNERILALLFMAEIAKDMEAYDE